MEDCAWVVRPDPASKGSLVPTLERKPVSAPRPGFVKVKVLASALNRACWVGLVGLFWRGCTAPQLTLARACRQLPRSRQLDHQAHVSEHPRRLHLGR
jgi:hypothetical protein